MGENEANEIKKNGKLVVCGHEITMEDVRFVYELDDKSMQEQYETNSDGEV